MHASPYQGYRFPPIIIQHAVWVYLRFTMSLRTSRTCSQSAVSRCPMRPFAVGSTTSVPFTPAPCGPLGQSRRATGTLMRFSSRSPTGRCISGGPSTAKARCSTSWFKPGAMKAALRLMKKLLRRQGAPPALIVTDRYRAYDAALRILGLTRVHGKGKRPNKQG